MDILKGYKYRLHPMAAQNELMIKTISYARFIYNKLLEDRIKIHEEAKTSGGSKRKPPIPASYKPLFPFLCEAGKVRLPKVGFIRFTQHRGFDG